MEEEQEMQIEGLRSDYCDDFVCTSSPAVEQTVRSLAKDLVRRSWTPSLFTRDVRYKVSVGDMEPRKCVLLLADMPSERS